MYTLKGETPIREIETKTEAYLQKYASSIEAIIEVIDNLNNNCPNNCIKRLKEILQKHGIVINHHPEGGPSTDSTRLTEVIDNAKIGREII